MTEDDIELPRVVIDDEQAFTKHMTRKSEEKKFSDAMVAFLNPDDGDGARYAVMQPEAAGWRDMTVSSPEFAAILGRVGYHIVADEKETLVFPVDNSEDTLGFTVESALDIVKRVAEACEQNALIPLPTSVTLKRALETMISNSRVRPQPTSHGPSALQTLPRLS